MSDDPTELGVVRRTTAVLDAHPRVVGDHPLAVIGEGWPAAKAATPDGLHIWAVVRDDELVTAVRSLTDLSRLAGVGDVFERSLRARGFTSIVDIAWATPDELTEVSGIGPIRASRIHRSARDLLEADAVSADRG